MDTAAPGAAWRRCDPRARLLATGLISAAALAGTGAPALAVSGAATAALLASSGTPPAAAVGALRPFRFLLAFTFVMQALFAPGAAPAAAALLGTGRLALVVVLSAHLVATTSPFDLARGLGWAFSPLARLGVPVREAELVLALGFRFVPELQEESRQVRAALESRGISAHHPRLRMRLRALLVWLVAVLFGMVERSGRLAAALETKGFALPGRRPRRPGPWTRESSLLAAGAAAAAALALLAPG